MMLGGQQETSMVLCETYSRDKPHLQGHMFKDLYQFVRVGAALNSSKLPEIRMFMCSSTSLCVDRLIQQAKECDSLSAGLQAAFMTYAKTCLGEDMILVQRCDFLALMYLYICMKREQQEPRFSSIQEIAAPAPQPQLESVGTQSDLPHT